MTDEERARLYGAVVAMRALAEEMIVTVISSRPNWRKELDGLESRLSERPALFPEAVPESDLPAILAAAGSELSASLRTIEERCELLASRPRRSRS